MKILKECFGQSHHIIANTFLTVAALAMALAAGAQQANITVAVDQPGHKISPTLWGIFFEDINMSADGGIYPELVRNRSFEDSDQPDDWTVLNPSNDTHVISIDSSRPLNPFNRKSLRVDVSGSVTLENKGYWGMNMIKGDIYTFKLAARADKNFQPSLLVKIVNASGTVLASGEISDLTQNWKYHELELTATDSDPKASLQISTTGQGVLFLDMVSLMPKKTWKDHGLRLDLAEALDGLNPRFVRFPGGCWVEGDDAAHMNHWKNTIGNIDIRTPLWNLWKYDDTQGMGFHEYLQMAEDLGAEPLFCINIGMSHHEVIPLDRMDQWVQDALDAIEYANGPTDSVWGKMRAEAGHPAPFHLKQLEIGNENSGAAYFERWPLFYKAIKEKYPEVKLVADLWGNYGNNQPDVVDDHYYQSPEWFMRHANLYDKKDRNGPKVFVGEYAVTQDCGMGNLRAAIGEAAFMTGLERNSDEVIMASYAPLLVNMNHRTWSPDLIDFDSSKWYGLPSYYAQSMFSENRGDVYLPTEVRVAADGGASDGVAGGQIGVGTWETAAEFKDIQVTAPDGKVLFESDFSNGTKGWKLLGEGADWKAQDGSLRQSARGTFIRALAGKREWTDYTLTLKARKISGAEGFLILFHINGDTDRTWWNIGGWGNTQNAVEAGELLDPKPANIQENRWYDIKVVLNGKNAKCYLDGQLIHDVNCESGGPVASLYATSATDAQTGDIIVKVVNGTADPLETEIHLSGAKDLPGTGTAIALTSENAADENSLENPTKVSPKKESVSFSGTTLTRSFPGNSLTVLRLKTSK
jgi:alpha-L-arabinofuranosidase